MSIPATFESIAVRCRNTEQFGDGSPALRLRTNRPKIWFAASLPGMPLAKLKEIFFRGVNKWALVSNVRAIEATSQGEADWIIVPSRIDGKNGVLADMMMPGPNPQYMRLDVAENASEEQLEQTCMHEAGHGFGLFHTPAGPPPEVMDPSLNMSVRTPQAAEAKLMESMYGPPITQPGPQSPLPTANGGLTCVVRLADDGKTIDCNIEASKPGFAATLAGKKTWQPSPAPQAIYVDRYPTGAVIVPQPEEWDEDTDLPDTEILGPGELT